MPEKLVLSWSGGKDSAMALEALLGDERYEVVGLLTSVAEEYKRISHHGVREELLDAQAESVGLPLDKLYLPSDGGVPCTNEHYEKLMREALQPYCDAGVMRVAHGDLFLEDLRAYREKNLARMGMRGVFPLWKRDTAQLIQTFIRSGYKAYLSCVEGVLGRFVREIEWVFLELRKHVSQQDYERMVVDSASAIMRETVGGVLKFANTALNPREQARYGGKSSADAANRGGRARLGNALVRFMDPSRFAHFLTGDSDVSNVDIAQGQIDIDIPDCAWHRVVESDSLPVLGQLPEQGCLVMCKATCERVFDGRDGLRIEFEPRLPETGCAMRVRWSS